MTAPDPAPSIALVYLPTEKAMPDWPGEKRLLPDNLFHAAATVKALVAQTDAEYVLFWDGAFGAPDIDRCHTLLTCPGEVWHAGLKLGCTGQPEVLQYINPVWMLQLDAPAELASDSWRLSIQACLIKTDIIRATGVFNADYSSLEVAGIDWGYRMHRAGTLIRHEPALVQNTLEPCSIVFQQSDALRFTASHFSRKWYYWVVFRLLANGAPITGIIRAIRRSISTRKSTIRTVSRNVELEKDAFQAGDWQGQVSVLMPTLNRYPYAVNTLEQLRKQVIRPKEVLVTDQSDASIRWDGFALDYQNVRVFPQTEKGQCLAWNKLLEESTAPFVLFLGDDADGIRPDFLEAMCRTMSYYQADMVAGNVLEIGGAPDMYSDRVIKLADGFPITLIRKDLVIRAGKMDMAFNKGIRADQDLAIRCRLLGAHMIFDSHIRILHHRAPTGGLRWHRQRVLTNYLSKNYPFKLQYPAESEYYLFRKHFSLKQRREHALILLVSQLSVQGSILKKLLRIGYFMIKLPRLMIRYRRIYR